MCERGRPHGFARSHGSQPSPSRWVASWRDRIWCVRLVGLARADAIDSFELLSMAAQALVLAYALPLFGRRAGFVKDGAHVGIILGAFAISYPLTLYALWTGSHTEMAAESIHGLLPWRSQAPPQSGCTST